LTYANVSDGTWHTAYVSRIGQWLELKLDGGEGWNFNESFGFPDGHREIRLSQRNIFAGGDVRFPSSSSLPLVDHDFVNGNHYELSGFGIRCIIQLNLCQCYLCSVTVFIRP